MCARILCFHLDEVHFHSCGVFRIFVHVQGQCRHLLRNWKKLERNKIRRSFLSLWRANVCIMPSFINRLMRSAIQSIEKMLAKIFAPRNISHILRIFVRFHANLQLMRTRVYICSLSLSHYSYISDSSVDCPWEISVSKALQRGSSRLQNQMRILFGMLGRRC